MPRSIGQLLAMLLVAGSLEAQTMKLETAKLEAELAAKYGESERPAIARGLKQAAALWRTEDGDAAAFADFARANYAGDAATKEALFTRLQAALESLDGAMIEITRDFRMQSDLDRGPIYPFDETLAGYDASAHVLDDFFADKLAFTVLLNFPLTTLDEKLAQGARWTRRQWAEARLADRFDKRIPAEVNLAIGRATAEGNQYIAEYNVWMHHLVDAKGERLFPPKMRLLSHWNLRDEIKADYADSKNGLEKQRMIAQVCDRIVTQTIPAVVVDNPFADWDPSANTVKATTERDSDKDFP